MHLCIKKTKAVNKLLSLKAALEYHFPLPHRKENRRHSEDVDGQELTLKVYFFQKYFILLLTYCNFGSIFSFFDC